MDFKNIAIFISYKDKLLLNALSEIAGTLQLLSMNTHVYK